MSETSTIRLSKVLKEFSIGIDHALDFLEKKGIKVEKNPNAKITMVGKIDISILQDLVKENNLINTLYWY